MSSIKIDQIKKVHFIGIGGIGMSALARLHKFDKKEVSGSDASDSQILSALEEEDIKIFREQVAENISSDTELFVYTEAMPENNPELVAARKTKKPVINYFEALGLSVNPYYLIAVCGTHGKTTTTAMLTDVFESAEKDPTAVIGSLRSSTKSNFRSGKSKYAIVEACEYKRDFLHLTPDVLVILNIEYEHVDYYKSLADVQSAFKEFIGKVHDSGYIVANLSDKNVAEVVKDAPVPVYDFTKMVDLTMEMRQPGLHNRFNAAAALTVAKQEKLDIEEAKSAVGKFTGTWRRFEFKGDVNGAIVYDDYAHHPTEIKATLAAAREAHPDKRITAVFRPHTYSRTKELFEDFAKSFAGADRILLLPVYAAREEADKSVSVRELAVRALEYCQDSHYVDSFEQAQDIIEQSVGHDDVVVIMGAGDATNLATLLTK